MAPIELSGPLLISMKIIINITPFVKFSYSFHFPSLTKAASASGT